MERLKKKRFLFAITAQTKVIGPRILPSRSLLNSLFFSSNFHQILKFFLSLHLSNFNLSFSSSIQRVGFHHLKLLWLLCNAHNSTQFKHSTQFKDVNNYFELHSNRESIFHSILIHSFIQISNVRNTVRNHF